MDLAAFDLETEGPLTRLDPGALDDLGPEALDDLPFGVIGLDAATGRVEVYNLAEAKLARLDRAQVLGKRFFARVAPCTATPEFQGRFEAFRSSSEPVLAFDYLFDFQFGAQEVHIELVRSRNPDRIWIVVNRTRFFAPRPDLPPGWAAPTQRELAPTEAQEGVLRQTDGRRSVQVPAPFFQALRTTWDRVAPAAWGQFCLEWGFRWGRYAVVDLEVQALEDRGKTLRELPVEEVLAQLTAYVQAQGWGRLVTDFSPTRRTGAFVLQLDRNALAEAAGASSAPRCALLSGFFRAIFCHLANRLLVVREVSCRAQGHATCHFVVVAQQRKALLDDLLSNAHSPSLERVLDALARPTDAQN